MDRLGDLSIDPEISDDPHDAHDERGDQRESEHASQHDFHAADGLRHNGVQRAGLDVLGDAPAGEHQHDRQDQPAHGREDEDHVPLDLNVGLLVRARQEPGAEHEQDGENAEDQKRLAADGFAKGEHGDGPNATQREFGDVAQALVQLSQHRQEAARAHGGEGRHAGHDQNQNDNEPGHFDPVAESLDRIEWQDVKIHNPPTMI